MSDIRMPFTSIFNVTGEQIIPHVHIAIGNVTFAAGVPVPPDLNVSGTKIGDLWDCDFAVKAEESLIIIVGFYPGDD